MTALLAAGAGCVERTLSVQSDPPGALVYLNDEEIGRTPVRRDFLWYGDYSVTLRKDGFQTLKTHQKIWAPIYEWVPLDLVSELLPIPLKDHRSLTYSLQPAPPIDDHGALLDRALTLRSQLESTHATTPTTRKSHATSRPTTHKK